MFGASEEQIRRVLEDEADEEDVPAAEDWSHDQGSRSCPAEHFRA